MVTQYLNESYFVQKDSLLQPAECHSTQYRDYFIPYSWFTYLWWQLITGELFIVTGGW